VTTVAGLAERAAPAAARALAGIDIFAARIAGESWFSGTGLPPTEAEAADARAYLAAGSGRDAALVWVGSWAEAERTTRAPEGLAWWDAEDAVRAGLLEALGAFAGTPGYLAAMNRVMTTATDTVLGAAAVAAAREGVADQALIRVAAGAATQACYQAALAGAAGGGGDHPFAAKYRLFAGGRWPLGVVGGAFYLF